MLRILIVQFDSVTRIKLSQFLSTFGTSTIAVNSKQSIEIFQTALREDEPFGLVTLDASLPDISPADMVRRLRRLESFETPLPGYVKAKILLILPPDVDTSNPVLEGMGCDGLLRKTFNRQSLSEAVKVLGFEEAPGKATSMPPKNDNKGTAARGISLEEGRLAALLQQAARMSEDEFVAFATRLAEHLGPAFAELMVRALSSPGVSRPVLMRLTHAAGSLKNKAFCDPLKEIAKTNPNLNIRREAILAIAGIDNEEAVNALNDLLKLINITSLCSIINNEVSRITEANPHLALIRTFREGEKDIKSFNNSLIVLKRIVRPEDLAAFMPMLDAEALLVRTGAFELLCEKLGPEGGSRLGEYFISSFNSTPDSTETVHGSRYHLSLQLERYLRRHPGIIPDFGDQLIALLDRTEDPRVREIFIGILCHCPGRPYRDFALACYSKWTDIRESLIPRLAEDDRCIDFLLEEYRGGSRQSGQLLTALLGTEMGCRYFAAAFGQADMDLRLQLLEGVQPHNYEYLRDMVKIALQDQDRDIRTLALDKIRAARDIEAGTVLLDGNRQAEYLQSEGTYLAVVAELFPFKAISLFLSRDAPDDLEVRPLVDHLDIFQRLCEFEPIPPPLNEKIFQGLVQYISTLAYEAPCQNLLLMIQKIKAYDRTNLSVIQNALNFYVSIREQNFTAQESNEVKKCREGLNSLAEDIRIIEEGYRNIDLLLRKPQMNYDLLENIIRSHHPAFCLRRQEIIGRLCSTLSSQDALEVSRTRGLIVKHRLLPCCFKDHIDRLRLYPGHHIGPSEHPRFNLHFGDKPLATFLGSHLEELFPEFPVVMDAPIQSEDCWVADVSGFRKAVPAQAATSARKYVILENPGQFQEVKELNPVTFLAPLSIYRLIKDLLQDIFL